MTRRGKSGADEELSLLRQRCAESEAALAAIKAGFVDAVIAPGPDGQQIYSRTGADLPYRAFVEQMQEGAVNLNPAGTILYSNRRFAEMMRMPLEKLFATSIENFVAASDRDLLRSLLQSAQAGSTRGEINLKADDGTVVPVTLSISVKPDDLEPSFCVVITDLSEQKQMENVAAAGQLARSILDHAAEAIVVCDREGRLTHISPAAQRLCGRNPLRHSFESVFPLELQQRPGGISPRDNATLSGMSAAEVYLRTALAGQTVKGVEATFHRTNSESGHPGEKVDLLVSAGPLRDPDGEVRGCVITLTDISYQKRVEQRLSALNETLESRVAERTRLAEARSSQLKLLVSQLTQAEQRERRRLAQVLHDHLQQLLVASKLRLSTMRYDNDDSREPALVRLEGLLDEAIEASRSLIVELSPPVLYDRGLTAAITWLAKRMKDHYQLDVTVTADPDVQPAADELGAIMFQAVRELLINVVRHAGIKTARVHLARDAADRLRVTVEDEGKGFDQASGPSDGSEGFGLFGIRERFGLLGGDVAVDSTRGHGTRIRLVLPTSGVAVMKEEHTHRIHDDADEQANDRPISPQRIRVLLADDHKILREGLAGLLREQTDIEIVGEAIDGMMAIELARKLHPDVVIMDISMPRLNGIEAARRLTNEMPSVRIIGLSMHEEQDMDSAMRQAGAALCLTKGGPSGGLISAIRSLALSGSVKEG